MKNRKMCNGSLVKTRKHVQKSEKLNNSKRQIEQWFVELHTELQNNASTNK